MPQKTAGRALSGRFGLSRRIAAGLLCLSMCAVMRAQQATQPSPGSTSATAQSAPDQTLTPPLVGVSPVTATQGYATDGKRHFTFSTSVITAYDAQWKVLWTNAEPFKGLPEGVIHVGDGDYYRGKLYAPVENYQSCDDNTLQTLAIYSAKNRTLLESHDLSKYGHEISSVTVVSSSHSIYVTSFCEPTKIYQYDLKTFEPKEPLTLSRPITKIQGISWSKARKQFAVTSDSDDQKTGYVWAVSPEGKVTLLYTVPQRGELEGVDYTQKQIRYLRGHVWFLSPDIGRKGGAPLPPQPSATE